ncbi:uncharacterized protein RAG0_09134 [Rhynchosporium agropyri]|uniref:Uncharacterized protein n=1 Tax=Rhynchosporium agropyri TaxID=914238 RepID=A0A1E1KU38_9HELO|nr:uncharacterized protein RAG0_09134 [Rhynchosporium agropyri]
MSANRRGIYRAMTNNYACSYPVTIGADNWACEYIELMSKVRSVAHDDSKYKNESLVWTFDVARPKRHLYSSENPASPSYMMVPSGATIQSRIAVAFNVSPYQFGINLSPDHSGSLSRHSLISLSLQAL